MATIINDLKETFRRGEIHVRLIFINTIVFLAITLVQILLALFRVDISSWLRWIEMPASVSQFLLQPWSIITYMFLHAGVMHLLFNMLWLYWFGQLSLYFFTARHLRGVYIWGGICGALLYLLAFNLFPYFEDAVNYTYMVGASASVLAIVAAVAYREPNYQVNLLLLGRLPLKYFALIVIGIDLLFVTADNAGGHIAHLGGALGGLLFAYMLNKGVDLTYYINVIIDALSRFFTAFFGGSSRFFIVFFEGLSRLLTVFRQPIKPQKPRMKATYGEAIKEETSKPDVEPQPFNQSRIDEIRAKIKQSGYQGLTEEEKKELFNASIR